MGTTTRFRVIVPGPESRKRDLYLNRTAEAAAVHLPTTDDLRNHDAAGFNLSWVLVSKSLASWRSWS